MSRRVKLCLRAGVHVHPNGGISTSIILVGGEAHSLVYVLGQVASFFFTMEAKSE